MPIYHKLILGWLPQKVEDLESGLSSGELHPNEVKMNLAREIVSIFYSPEDAEASQKRWDEVFRSGGDGIPDDIPEETIEGDEERVLDILRRLKMVGSGKEAKNLIKQGGVQLDQSPIEDNNTVVDG